MSWGNPWAWLGLLALAVPVLIHMLGRRQAKTLPFPTLRFLEKSRLQPVRRTRVQDFALLAIRLSVLLFAVAALGQPRFDRSRDTATASVLARVVLVDTSASMRRPASIATQADPANGETAATIARREARQLAGEAATSAVVETASPAAELAGAAAWLGIQPGPGDIVIVSDFQYGAVDSAALAAVAIPIGIDLRRIAVEVATLPVETTSRSAAFETVARATPTADGLDIEWTFRPGAAISLDGLSLLADEADAEAARDAVAAASRALPDVRFDAERPVAVVYEGYAGRAALLRDAQPPGEPWMADAIRRVHEDALLPVAAERAEPIAELDVALSPAGPFVRIGEPSASATIAASAAIDGRTCLVFFTNASPASLTSAALVGAIGRALSDRPSVSELDPLVMADSTLASWRRAPGPRTTAVTDDATSDGRWFWLVALALLAVETLYRRRADTLRNGAAADVETVS